MLILYLDESGTVKNPNEGYFVIGGCAVFERQTYHLSNDLDDIAARYFPNAPDPIEFHAGPILQHRDKPWKNVPQASRQSILSDVDDLISRSRTPGVTLFGAAISKDKAQRGGHDPVVLALQEVCQRFDIFLANLAPDWGEQRGLIVMDRTHEEERLRPLVLAWRAAGTPFGRLRHFAEVPLFTDSTATRLLQLADFTAYAVSRRYERKDTTYLDKIIHKFHADDAGCMHGLVHYCAQHQACHCPACLSRRLSATGRADPPIGSPTS